MRRDGWAPACAGATVTGRGATRPWARRVPRRGIALLEAMVALVIVAVAATAGATLAADATRAVGRVRERDAAMRRASALLDAVALWPREDLDRHLGDRAEGAWMLRIARPTPTLYIVALLPATAADTASPGIASADSSRGDAHPLLETALYRPLDTPAAHDVARP